MCAILPTSVLLPVAVTIIALPCVTGVCMKAMFDCSPGPRSLAESVVASLAADALAGQGRLIDLQRAGGDDSPVRRDLVTRRDQYDVADDELLGRNHGLGAVAPHSRGCLHHRLSAFIALSALPAWRSPVRALKGDHGQDNGRGPLLDQKRDDRRPDQDQLHVARELARKRRSGDGGCSTGSEFGPSRFSRPAASAAERPV